MATSSQNRTVRDCTKNALDDLTTDGLFYQFVAYKRPPSVSKRQIAEWCSGLAAAIQEKIPAVRRLTICETLEDSPHGRPPFDVFLEVGFASREELNCAYRKDGLEKLMEDAEKSDRILHGNESIQRAWVKEHIVRLLPSRTDYPKKEGMIRQFGSYKCPPTVSKAKLMQWWFDHARRGRGIAGIEWYTICETVEHSPFPLLPFDAYAADWFADLQSINRTFHSREWQESAKDGREELGFDIPGRVQIVWASERISKSQ